MFLGMSPWMHPQSPHTHMFMGMIPRPAFIGAYSTCFFLGMSLWMHPQSPHTHMLTGTSLRVAVNRDMAGRKLGRLKVAATTAALCVHIAAAALVQHDLRVSIMRGAPDCYPKNLIVANKQWQYPIVVTQGDTLEVSVAWTISGA